MTRKKKRRQSVLITVQGGVAYIDRVPKGTTVILRDYDIEEENDYTKQDRNGRLYVEQRQTGKGSRQ